MAGGTTKTSDNIFEDNGIKVPDSLWAAVAHASKCVALPRATLKALLKMGLEENEELIKRLKQGHGDFNSWTKLDGILAGCAELLNTYNSE
ncbi:hypothetical protein niasHT_032888 [Heterodera trifolii]|uniref:Uncharacterized protein n=1 Tax=Heterodera trifolii TaxID=157864 RepID=A0ABD2ITE4_9BILA